MRIGVLLWNALALLRRGDESVWRALADYFRSLPEPESAAMAGLVAEAVRRKNERHPDDIRIVRRWKLKLRDDGTASLWAEASAPGA